MALASFFFSLMALCVKLVPRVPVHEVVFFRAWVALVISYSLLRRRGVHVWGNNKRLLMMRGVFGTIALMAYFTTLHHLPLSTATTIQHLSPVFTAVVSALVLGETVGLPRWLCFALSFAGVALIKGFDPTVNWLYLGLGILAAFSSALAYNCIAKLRTGEDAQVIIFYFPLVTVPLVAPYTLTHWVPPTASEWGLLLLIGVLVQTAQYFMTLSYQFGRASAVSIVSYLGVLFALVYDWTLFSVVPPAPALGGMMLVITGVALATVLGTRETAKERRKGAAS